jgi:hypothetical protein
MELPTAQNIVAEYFDFFNKLNEKGVKEGEVGYREYLLPHSKFTIKEAILICYENSEKSEKDSEGYGMLYMTLGSFGEFEDSDEIVEESKKWAQEWFQITEPK